MHAGRLGNRQSQILAKFYLVIMAAYGHNNCLL